MKIKFPFFIFFAVNMLFSITIDDIKNWDKLDQYNRICQSEVRDIFIEKQNISMANIYANACLKMDKVNELIIPIVMLYKTKEERENASLYATVLFQKKMLYLSLVDGFDISFIKTPKVDYILSIIFDKYVNKDYIKNNGIYKFILDKENSCNLFIKNEDGIDKMIIALYRNEKLISIKKFW
ncbi:hypothetical protein CBLAS_0818 [Campylobacter blaseri]|uniref:Uncharacterized protein n=1 Tax=Campylobacter blaseri TaxID=2042961 RepID=A0A2P8R2G3_9BACT|nr:hypothetical protein [Campylobacter blaseri]PSM52704.1 hypothetical protein CQ405_02950 [Campylobacter blaseri]PSM54352.1 hypothetical protein CRN67_02950 [Campylobacter blaseri]QKF86005.1 hypothetical protein CBLAS_0818 [Campylobacter blaseri]